MPDTKKQDLFPKKAKQQTKLNSLSIASVANW